MIHLKMKNDFTLKRKVINNRKVTYTIKKAFLKYRKILNRILSLVDLLKQRNIKILLKMNLKTYSVRMNLD